MKKILSIILVKGVPLMWTLYDVSYMDGTHQ